MRAGLLSNPEVIRTINDKFVSTWVIHPYLVRLADKGDAMAKHILEKWEYPVDLMFLTPEGKLISKLNSGKDFPDVHGDVATPPNIFKKKGEKWPSHVEIFMKHVAEHFGTE